VAFGGADYGVAGEAEALGSPPIGVADTLAVGTLIGVAGTNGVGAAPMPGWPVGAPARNTGSEVASPLGTKPEPPPHAESNAAARAMTPSIATAELARIHDPLSARAPGDSAAHRRRPNLLARFAMVRIFG
jgi:hypothetical protein